jgi:hypothetical protein
VRDAVAVAEDDCIDDLLEVVSAEVFFKPTRLRDEVKKLTTSRQFDDNVCHLLCRIFLDVKLLIIVE